MNEIKMQIKTLRAKYSISHTSYKQMTKNTKAIKISKRQTKSMFVQ